MKKFLLIATGIALGVAAYVYLDPELNRKVRHQLNDAINPDSSLVYKWQDEQGRLQVSNTPPPPGVKYEVSTYDRNTNVVPSTTRPAKNTKQ